MTKDSTIPTANQGIDWSEIHNRLETSRQALEQDSELGIVVTVIDALADHGRIRSIFYQSSLEVTRRYCKVLEVWSHQFDFLPVQDRIHINYIRAVISGIANNRFGLAVFADVRRYNMHRNWVVDALLSFGRSLSKARLLTVDKGRTAK